MKSPLPLSEVYRLIEPGPVLLLGTQRRGVPNVMPMSWHCMMEFEPPLIGCVVSGNDFSFAALKNRRVCTLNIPQRDLAEQLVACGNSSGRSLDKFAAFGLHAEPASLVEAPLITECFANLECRVVDTRLVNTYNFFVLEVLKAWHDPGVSQPQTLHHRGYGTFMLAGEEIVLASRMP